MMSYWIKLSFLLLILTDLPTTFVLLCLDESFDDER